LKLIFSKIRLIFIRFEPYFPFISDSKTNEIIDIIRQNSGISSGNIHALLNQSMSYPTVKRKIAGLLFNNSIQEDIFGAN